MNEKYIVDRITQLRLEKNISEYELSYALGFSKSYANMIAREKSLPSLNAFLAICDYFEITPLQFFAPYLTEETVNDLHMFLDLTSSEKAMIRDIMSALIIKRTLESHDSVVLDTPKE